MATNVKKADKILGMIRTFSLMKKYMLQQLIKLFIIPHLEYTQLLSRPSLPTRGKISIS